MTWSFFVFLALLGTFSGGLCSSHSGFALLVGVAVKEVHLGEGCVHLLENVLQLGQVHVVRHNVQN